MKREELFIHTWNKIANKALKQELSLAVIRDMQRVFKDLYLLNYSTTIQKETKDFFAEMGFKTKSNGIGYSINYY